MRWWWWLLSRWAVWRSRFAAPPVAIAPAPPAPAARPAVPTRAALELMAEAAAATYGIPAAILKGLVAHESRWNPDAVRQEPAIGDASRGLTQVLLRTAEGEGYTGAAAGLFDPVVNLDIGARYLARMFRLWGTWPAALAAYNAGPAAGRVVTVPTTSILARDQVTGEPIRSYTAQPGEFRNQPYVNAVLAEAASYGGPGMTLAGVSGPIGALLVLGLLGGALLRWKGGR